MYETNEKLLDTKDDMKNDNYNEKYFMESQRAQKIADLEKDRIERYRSQFPRRGFMASWRSIIKQDIKVGDKVLLLSTPFVVTSISNDGIAECENGEVGARLVWQDKGEWSYNHITYLLKYRGEITTV